MVRLAIPLTFLLAAISASGCTQTPLQACQSVDLCVDCEATCKRMLECRVGFAETTGGLPGQDQSDQARCERGCANTDTITPQRERCILSANPDNPQRCHDDILICLGVDGGAGY